MRSHLLDRLPTAADRTLSWLTNQIEADGSLGPGNDDLACFYKLPYLMQLAGRVCETHRLLDFIQTTFMQANGDFGTSAETKSVDPVLSLYPGYINGWIAIAAHKAGRFEISFPAWEYLHGFHNRELGGFTTEHAESRSDSPVEVLMSAHLGLAALYFGDRERAMGVGRVLGRFVELQPDIENRFLLRMNIRGELQTDFPADAAGLHVIDANQGGQAWFFVGYPMAFLARLYCATGNRAFLASACSYFDFALRCEQRLVSEHFAHKVAWGAAELARATKDPGQLKLSEDITERLITAQDDKGTWMADQPMHTRLDQSTEVAIWLLEIWGAVDQIRL